MAPSYMATLNKFLPSRTINLMHTFKKPIDPSLHFATDSTVEFRFSLKVNCAHTNGHRNLSQRVEESPFLQRQSPHIKRHRHCRAKTNHYKIALCYTIHKFWGDTSRPFLILAKRESTKRELDTLLRSCDSNITACDIILTSNLATECGFRCEEVGCPSRGINLHTDLVGGGASAKNEARREAPPWHAFKLGPPHALTSIRFWRMSLDSAHSLSQVHVTGRHHHHNRNKHHQASKPNIATSHCLLMPSVRISCKTQNAGPRACSCVTVNVK